MSKSSVNAQEVSLQLHRRDSSPSHPPPHGTESEQMWQESHQLLSISSQFWAKYRLRQRSPKIGRLRAKRGRPLNCCEFPRDPFGSRPHLPLSQSSTPALHSRLSVATCKRVSVFCRRLTSASSHTSPAGQTPATSPETPRSSASARTSDFMAGAIGALQE